MSFETLLDRPFFAFGDSVFGEGRRIKLSNIYICFYNSTMKPGIRTNSKVIETKRIKYCHYKRRIGHFRVALCLIFKTSPRAKPFK